MSRFLNRSLKELTPYVPGEQPRGEERLIKLNTNESPFPPSPLVLDALSRAEAEKLRLYPDPTCRAAAEAIAREVGVSPAQVALGNGSDELLAFAFHGFCENGAAFADITYGFYRVFCEMFHVKACVVPLREDYSVRVEDYAGRKETVFLANPNAPTGLSLPLCAVRALLEQDKNRLVVVDEAYVDFGGESAVALLPECENLLVVRTFSKSRSLAGARVGFAVASEALAADLNALRFSFNPYNINRLSLLAAEYAMRDRAYFARCRDAIIENREWTRQQLQERGFTVLESKANFLFAKGPLGGQEYLTALRARGILVRWFSAPRTRDFVRISIGTRADMEALIRATDEILREAGHEKGND